LRALRLFRGRDEQEFHALQFAQDTVGVHLEPEPELEEADGDDEEQAQMAPGGRRANRANRMAEAAQLMQMMEMARQRREEAQLFGEDSYTGPGRMNAGREKKMRAGGEADSPIQDKLGLGSLVTGVGGIGVGAAGSITNALGRDEDYGSVNTAEKAGYGLQIAGGGIRGAAGLLDVGRSIGMGVEASRMKKRGGAYGYLGKSMNRRAVRAGLAGAGNIGAGATSISQAAMMLQGDMRSEAGFAGAAGGLLSTGVAAAQTGIAARRAVAAKRKARKLRGMNITKPSVRQAANYYAKRFELKGSAQTMSAVGSGIATGGGIACCIVRPHGGSLAGVPLGSIISLWERGG